MESKTNPFSNLDPTAFIGKVFDEFEIALTPTESILYSLAIGFNLHDALKKEHFKFTYENDADFQTFPTIT